MIFFSRYLQFSPENDKTYIKKLTFRDSPENLIYCGRNLALLILVASYLT